jgi:hypothetical protein
MKNILFLLAFGVSTSKAYCQLIAEYRFDGDVSTAFYFNPLLLTSAGNFTAGPGVGTLPTGLYSTGPNNPPATNNRARIGNSWSQTFSPIIDISDYYGLVLNALAGYTIVVDSVNMYQRSSGTGPSFWQLKTSADGYLGIIGTGSTTFAIGPNPQPFGRCSITSGLPTFTGSLGIRIFAAGATGTPTGDFSGTWRIDSVRVYAHGYSTLPVELLSFTGEVVDQDVELSWTTASELNNAHFEILRSDDGQAWYKVGRVIGSGTTMIPRDYGFLDSDPPVGTNYYKLRQVDFDGAYEDSRTISVEVLSEQWFRRARDEILSDEPTMLFDELGRILSGPSREHKINRTGIVIIRKEDGTRSERLFFEP